MAKSESGTPGGPLVVVIDDQPQLEYDRNKALSARQLEDLGKMDRQMDQGLRLASDWIDRPSALHRAQFVAVQLSEAFRRADEALAAACCAYLADRLPDLKQVRAKSHGGSISVELVFDKPFASETVITFVPRSTT
jgi:hypothetical protein